MANQFKTKIKNWWRRVREKNIREHIRDLFSNPGESKELKAASVGFGVFMGIVPLWGYQTLVALGLAQILRLNKGIVVLGTMISLPPLPPLLIYLSYKFGALFMGKKARYLDFSKDLSFDVIKEGMAQYLIGGFVLSHHHRHQYRTDCLCFDAFLSDAEQEIRETKP